MSSDVDVQARMELSDHSPYVQEKVSLDLITCSPTVERQDERRANWDSYWRSSVYGTCHGLVRSKVVPHFFKKDNIGNCLNLPNFRTISSIL